MIPDINNKKWQEIINGNIRVKITSFSLQMKISSLQGHYKNDLISMKSAINDLYEMCKKYEKIYENDLNNIFKQ